jgi:hypothetical protein
LIYAYQHLEQQIFVDIINKIADNIHNEKETNQGVHALHEILAKVWQCASSAIVLGKKSPRAH